MSTLGLQAETATSLRVASWYRPTKTGMHEKHAPTVGSVIVHDLKLKLQGIITMNSSEEVKPALAEKSASGPTTIVSKAMSKPSILTTSSSKSNATRASRRISLRGSKRRVDIDKATAAWGMYADRTLGAKLTITHLADLHEIFEKIGHPLTRADFIKALGDLNIRLEDDVFDLTFLKMDTKLDGEVSWDDVVSFLLIELLENQEVGEPQEDMLRLPISSPPEIFDALHRHPIIRITFIPEINKDRSVDYMYGKFVTACKEGTIRFWSSSLVHEKTVTSGSALLKVRPTWVTDMVAMPDINIIGTSSTDRELRFYDMTANKWELRVLIWGVDKPVVKMHYHFGQNRSDDSCLIVGDCGGSVRILMFNSYRKGPFRQDLGGNVVSVRFTDLIKGGLPGLHVVEFLNVHSDWIRQVSYHVKSNSFMSCATCSKTSVFMGDIFGTKSQYQYDVPGGVTCFSVAEETHILVTGGPDCNVRVWNLFVSRKPAFTLIGHHATIVSIALQALGNRVYSMDMSRSVRVWNCTNQTCIQTFREVMAPIENPFSTYYQPHARTWMIASNKITVLHCCPKLFDDRTDGFTHTKPVTVVLYNALFRCVITAGVDSSIMVWDPWRGRRTLLIRNAHLRTVYGKQEGVEITAACFDPPQQQLLTGARNGTLKVWNFNTGNCVRNMTVGSSLEVTSVMWVPQRILAVSWNKLVTEWADSGADLYGKQWEARHTDDITCAAVKPHECLASASSNGELVLWQLETGQPYARYNVTQPVHKSGMMHYVEEPVLPPRSWLRVKLPDCLGADTAPPVIHCMQFLTARAVSRGVGTLLVSLSTGRIQVWSHHQVGGYLTDFLAVHVLSDYVACMTVDPECNYLFTGHAAGYIKMWLMSNFCYPGGPTVSLFRPALRKEFPFLNVDRLLGRAKRAVRNQPLPMLLSSLRGHRNAVSSIEFLPKNKMIISGSADHTVRIWTLAGEYIGTLGTFRPWITLAPGVEWDTSGAPNIPADLKRNSSFTTMKVLRRGYVDWSILLDTADPNYSAAGTGVYKELTMDELVRGTYGQRLYKPLLGRCFKLPNKALPKLPKIKLDTSLRKVEVFGHITLSDVSDITKPETPPSIQQGLDLRRSDGLKKKRQSVNAVRSEDLHSELSTREENSPTAEIGERTVKERTKKEEPYKTDPSGIVDESSPFETALATPVVPPSPSKQTSSRKVSLAVDLKTSSKSDSNNELKSDMQDESKSSRVPDN